MALRQLVITKKIQTLRKQLDALKSKDAEFEQRKAELKTREAELEAAINEVNDETPEEDKVAVDESVEAFEADQKALDNELKEHEDNKKKLEDEIKQLQDELDELNSRAATPVSNFTPKYENRERNNEEGGMRMKRGFFAGMNRSEIEAFIIREDVKEFLTRVREFKGEKRAVTGAELTIPEVMLDLLRDNLYRYSKLITKIRLKIVGGKARQNIMGAVPEGIWTEAVGKLNDLSFGLNQVEVDGYKVGGYIAIPNPTLDDSDLNLANEIMDMLGQAIGLAVDKAILYGTGTKMPLGIATRLAQIVEPDDWGANAPAWTNLSTTNLLKFDPTDMTPQEFFAELLLYLGVAKPNYSTGGTFWAMNRKTKMKLLSKAVTFNAAGALVAGVNNTMPIEGGDIVELPFIPDNDIVGGFGELYLLAERAGASLASSEHVKFIEDQTVFKGTARYDGMPVFGEGFVIVNINNTAPTTSITFPQDTANQ
ncbi:MAG: phage major capsid protein [Clostridiaceae bacterium]|nr:phage major capsid protein [Clostridiaceae bacterium]